jgi:serine/threonine protein kinase
MTKEIMTLWYRAPEVLLDNLSYSPEIDLWSAGVIIFEMLTGDHMFPGNSEIDMILKIFSLKGTPVSEVKERNPLQNITKLLNQKRWIPKEEK